MKKDVSLIQVQNIKKSFRTPRGSVRAVDGADLTVAPGEICGLVGESGSGKSTLGRIAAGLLAPDSGQVCYEGCPLTGLKGEAFKRFRRDVQVVFQDPMRSLNPRMTAAQILAEPFRIHAAAAAGSVGSAVTALLQKVGLSSIQGSRFPHELSGGERQRVSIARAIALKPRLILLDEAVSSLDVLVRAGILNLLLELHRSEGTGYLFISHDLRVVRFFCDKIAVMHSGRIVESGPAREVLDRPAQNYTRSLIRASGLSKIY